MATHIADFGRHKALLVLGEMPYHIPPNSLIAEVCEVRDEGKMKAEKR